MGGSHKRGLLYFIVYLQGSMDSQLEGGSLKAEHERKPSLTRSQTDSNITYSTEEQPEASGSTYYITKEGHIDFQVVLKVTHV